MAADARRPVAPTNGASWAALTPREQSVVALICRGCINKEMAPLLFISERRVKNVVRDINRKLGTYYKPEIVAHAAVHWPWLFSQRLSTDDDPVIYG